MRRKFSAAHTSLNSQQTFSMPLKLNCRKLKGVLHKTQARTLEAL